MSEITVLLTDDHEVVRSGYRRLLETTDDIAVVGEASSGEHHGRISVTVNIENLKHLQRIIKVIRGVPGVLEVERLMR